MSERELIKYKDMFLKEKDYRSELFSWHDLNDEEGKRLYSDFIDWLITRLAQSEEKLSKVRGWVEREIKMTDEYIKHNSQEIDAIKDVRILYCNSLSDLKQIIGEKE